MKNLTTISNETIKVSENKSKRTFTIITSGGKFRTYPMNRDEFNNATYLTGNDWSQFLKSEDYYKVK